MYLNNQLVNDSIKINANNVIAKKKPERSFSVESFFKLNKKHDALNENEKRIKNSSERFFSIQSLLISGNSSIQSLLIGGNILNNCEDTSDLTDPEIYSIIEKATKLGFTVDEVRELIRKYNGRIEDRYKFFEDLIIHEKLNEMNKMNQNNQNGQNNNAHNDDESDVEDGLDDETSFLKMKQVVKARDIQQQSLQQQKQNEISSFIENSAVSNVINSSVIQNISSNNNNNNNNMKFTLPSKTHQLNIHASDQTSVVDLSKKEEDKSNLRPILIDGNDVGMNADQNLFSMGRISKAVEYFETRFHTVHVILPPWRKDFPNQDPNASILMQLQQKKDLIQFSLSVQRSNNKRVTHDYGLHLLNCAKTLQGVVVSNESFKKYMNQSELKTIIESRVLVYSFLAEKFMPIEDPLGKSGPSLQNFLRFEPIINKEYLKPCPYKKKCTYGTKCKFQHPERQLTQQPFKTAHQTVIEDAHKENLKLEKLKAHAFNNRTVSDNNNFIKQQQQHHQIPQQILNQQHSQPQQQYTTSRVINQKPQFDPYFTNNINEFHPKSMFTNSIMHQQQTNYSDNDQHISFQKSFLQANIPETKPTVLISRGVNFNQQNFTQPKTYQPHINSHNSQNIQNVRTTYNNNITTMKSGRYEQQQQQQQPQNMWPHSLLSKQPNEFLPQNIKISDSSSYSTYKQFEANDSYFNNKSITNQRISSIDSKNTNMIKSSTVNTNTHHEDLYHRLLKRLTEDKVRWVLDAYKNEFDEDKLVLLAKDKDSSYFD